MCSHCTLPLLASYYEHMNTGYKYHVPCYEQLAKLSKAFALLCKLKF